MFASYLFALLFLCRPSPVQKLERYIEYVFIAVSNQYATSFRKRANNGGLYIVPRAYFFQGVPFIFWHGERHPLLRFGDPYLPWGETSILERHPLEIYLTAAALTCHLTHRSRQSSCAIVGNAVVEAFVARLADESVGEFLLGNRVADLHRRRWRAGSERFRRKCRAVDTIEPDSATDHHYVIPRPSRFFM